MRIISFLQYGREPEILESPYFTLTSELDGHILGDEVYTMTAVLKDVAYTMIVLNELKRFYDFEVYAIIEDGKVILTEEDEN